ncbi:arylsulfatase [Formosa agariphila KMM 3901]|uniref:Arylsulfatase n=1 Tax=Formosa agariphila (strain DSM 15362 / KCTC 12365 / LMG 23005 / KMM 3901 / M-2Alg 35-1) TaxID=1347342 RepID=T2KN31_FORAG|nr:arylsulfatase [Formosa agariphila KMM 3901]
MLLALITYQVQAQQKRYNIVWINADDLGRELSCYGHPAVHTPNIDGLAKQGVLYTNAYANAPVCSASRSSQITGMYPTAINSLDHRTLNVTTLPDGIQPITDFFKQAGYFVSNGNGWDLLKSEGKKDYNFIPDIKYDGTDWSQRKKGQSFFAQVQIKYPHRTFVKDEVNPINPDDVVLPKCYPDYPLLRADWAMYLESVQHCDEVVGQILNKLEEDGLAENTVVFFFGDHGRPHLRDKQFLYEGGLQIPLIIRWPNHLKAGEIDKRLVSLVDVAATSLAISGIKTPYELHGKVYLGKHKEKRKYIYGFRQRTGDAVENMRSITDGRYKLIWNRTYNRPWMQLSSYKKLQYPAFALYHYLHNKGELKAPYNQFMAATKPEFELFDLDKDPMEFENLADKKSSKKIQNKLFQILASQLKEYEKNMVLEDDVTIAEAKKGSEIYYEKALQQQKLEISVDATYEDIVKDWENRLLKK